MKRIIQNILIGVVISTLIWAPSCDNYFEEPITSSITLDTVFSDVLKAEKGLNAAYYLVPFMFPTAWSPVDNGYRNVSRVHQNTTASISDEAVSSLNWGGAHKLYYVGSMNALNAGVNNGDKRMFEHIFEEPYYYMRRAYIFLENVESVPGATQEFIDTKSAEAKLLIAMGYFELLKRYGSCPWVGSVIGANDEVDETRPPLAEFVDNIDRLIEEAKPNLPDRWDSSNRGRVNKASAYFLRSRLWLWAASPIFNNSTPFISGPADAAISFGSYDQDRWRKAADMAKEAIDYCESVGFSLVNTNDPILDYTLATRDLNGHVENTEVILFSREGGSYNGKHSANNFFGRHKPPSRNKSSKGCAASCPTHNFVQLYETVDGSDFDLSSSNPWEKLDPRFHASIIHDRAEYGGAVIGIMQKRDALAETIDTYNDEWITGYWLRKFMHPEHHTDQNLTFDMPYFYMRLPELYINYAEALNEYSPGHSDITTYINKTRQRVGMPNIPSLGQDEMREAIYREKAVEFAFEDQRYFDLKRWLRGEEIHKTKIGVKRSADGGYEIAEVPGDRQYIPWNDKFYLMPFPDYEIQKGLGLIQNPGF